MEPSQSTTNADSVQRTSDIEDFTNTFFIHPLSGRLVPLLARMHVSPNLVSAAGMICGLSAGIAYYRYQDLRYAIAGFCLMICWHVLDGADGQLARLTKSQSHFGRVLDGVCDYVTFAAVYGSLGLALDRRYGGWVWCLVAAAGISHAIQSAAYEMQRENYEFCGYGKAFATPQDQRPPSQEVFTGSFLQRTAERLFRQYARLQRRMTGGDHESRKRLDAILGFATTRDALVRCTYRNVFGPNVRRWSVMSANYHTLAIFFFTALKVPLYYFAFDIFGFGIVLLVLMGRQAGCYKRLFTVLAELEEKPADRHSA